MRLKTTLLNTLRLVFRYPYLERVLTKFTVGTTYDSWISRLPLNYTEYQHPSIRVVERNGIRYILDISDYMEWLVYFGIEIEPREILFNLIQPGDIVFDIGANIGETAMNMALKTGSQGQIHCFEPHPIISKKILQNLRLNTFENIYFNEIGLGNQKGEFMMSPEVSNNNGGNRVISSTNALAPTTVKLITLDEYVNNNRIHRLDLIKIDVEGYELKVLNGGLETIEKFHPTLFVEVNDRNLKQQNSSATELIKFLKKYYNSLILADANQPLTDDISLSNCHFDVIAAHEA